MFQSRPKHLRFWSEILNSVSPSKLLFIIFLHIRRCETDRIFSCSKRSKEAINQRRGVTISNLASNWGSLRFVSLSGHKLVSILRGETLGLNKQLRVIVMWSLVMLVPIGALKSVTWPEGQGDHALLCLNTLCLVNRQCSSDFVRFQVLTAENMKTGVTQKTTNHLFLQM